MDLEHPCGGGAIVTRRLQGPADDHRFCFSERTADGCHIDRGHSVGRRFDRSLRGVETLVEAREGGRHGGEVGGVETLDIRAKLADVSRPRILHERGAQVRTKLALGHVVQARVVFQIVIQEGRDIFGTGPKRGDLDPHDIQPMIQIAAELSLHHCLAKTFVRGGDEAYVHGYGSGVTDRGDLALLKKTKELRL